MKYLRLFESNNIEIISDIEDMFLECKDIGFNLEILTKSQSIELNIRFIYKRKLKTFYLNNDIRDFVLRTYQYMTELKFNSKIEANTEIYSLTTNKIIIRSDEIIKISKNYGKKDESWYTVENAYPYFFNIVMIFIYQH